MNCRQLHLIINGAGMGIERATEEKRKTQDIVYLVVIVRTSGANDDVTTHFFCLARRDLRIRIGHGKNNRVFGHDAQHVGGQRPFDRNPEKNIRTFHGIFKGTGIRLCCQALFIRVHTHSATVIYNTLGIAEDQLFFVNTHGN